MLAHIHDDVRARVDANAERRKGEKRIVWAHLQVIKCKVHHLPASRKTKPRDPFAGAAIEITPIVSNPMPIIKRVTAANTVRQFSRIFGWFQQCVYRSDGGTLVYSCISESLSRDVVSSAPNLLFLWMSTNQWNGLVVMVVAMVKVRASRSGNYLGSHVKDISLLTLLLAPALLVAGRGTFDTTVEPYTRIASSFSSSNASWIEKRGCCFILICYYIPDISKSRIGFLWHSTVSIVRWTMYGYRARACVCMRNLLFSMQFCWCCWCCSCLHHYYYWQQKRRVVYTAN